MLLSEFYTLAKSTVLKQLKVEDAVLLDLVNFSLKEVYKKFTILTNEQVLILSSTINEYELNNDFMGIVNAYTTSNYLTDNEGNLLHPTSSDVVELSFNDDSDPNTIYFPTYNKCMFSFPSEGQTVSVIYKASPRVIEANDPDNRLELPDQYLEPLLFYLAYLYNMSYSGDINQTQDNYLVKFEQSCDKINLLNLGNTASLQNLRLDDQGFV